MKIMISSLRPMLAKTVWFVVGSFREQISPGPGLGSHERDLIEPEKSGVWLCSLE